MKYWMAGILYKYRNKWHVQYLVGINQLTIVDIYILTGHVHSKI